MKLTQEEDFTFLEIEASDSSFRRLDILLAHAFPNLSRTFIKKLFEQEMIFSSEKIELKKIPKIGTQITLTIPPLIPLDAQPEAIDLDILFEDEHLLVINKNAGMVTHPAPGNYTGTLVNAVLYHCKDLSGIGNVQRPGIVHRLDKGTSGVMVVAKSQKAHEGLIELFSEHNIVRKYEAIVFGTNILNSGVIESKIGRSTTNRLKMSSNVKVGKRAITKYKLLRTYKKISHLELELFTGRTHQIRVHLSEILKRPILCDPLYANPKVQIQQLGDIYRDKIVDYPHPLLHAKTLDFIHPITKEYLEFTKESPKIFSDILSIAEQEIV